MYHINDCPLCGYNNAQITVHDAYGNQEFLEYQIECRGFRKNGKACTLKSNLYHSIPDAVEGWNRVDKLD